MKLSDSQKIGVGVLCAAILTTLLTIEFWYSPLYLGMGVILFCVVTLLEGKNQEELTEMRQEIREIKQKITDQELRAVGGRR